MPRLTKNPQSSLSFSKAFKKKKGPSFPFSLRSLYKTLLIGAFGLGGIWLCLSETPAKLKNQLILKIYDITAPANLSLRHIVIDGNFFTKKAELLKVLNIKIGNSILQYDPHDIRVKTENMPWVRSAKVQRIFPNTLIIKVAERLPIALYQKNKTLTLVDDYGNLIQFADAKKFAYLPIVIGEQAAERAPELFETLSAEPYLQKRLTAAILVSKRRWDLVIDKNIKIKLPESAIAESLKHLAKIEQDKHIDMNDIVSIDLRIPDRLYVQLKQKAAVARRAASPKSRV